MLFHGTCREFETFSDESIGSYTGAESSQLGHFLTTNPVIAASFTLHPDIVDQAYDTLKGSSVLLDPTWAARRNSNPYETGSKVMLVVADFRRPAVIEAKDYAAMVDDDIDWIACRNALIEAGYDAIQVRRNPELVAVGLLCFEYAADTWIALNGTSLRRSKDAEFHRAAAVAAASLDPLQEPTPSPSL